MNFFIVYFLPCILGLFLYYVLTKKNKYFELSIVYLLNVLFTNMCNMGVLYIKSSEIYSLVYRLEGDYRFAFKYILLSFVFTVILSIIFVVIEKYCNITMEVENGNKKKKDKK